MAMCEEVLVLPSCGFGAGALARRGLRRFAPALYCSLSRRPSDWSIVSRANRRRIRAFVARGRFDLVHVHRLYMLPILQSDSVLARLPACMDLDDIESMTRDRIATLARSNGDHEFADAMERDAEIYRRIERRELARLERVCVCSDVDRERLLARLGPRRVDVLPNVVDVPAPAPREPGPSGRPFVFLFVGALGYYPNHDAVAFLCREIVPQIRARVSRPFAMRVVSGGRQPAHQLVEDIPELSWAASEADLAYEYARADAAVVPIRAGGGTRIKVLEAFAQRVAVLSTRMGVEGLPVVHGEHAMVGDTAAELAAHAAALMEEAALRERLVENAFTLVRTAYGPAALRRRLEEMYAGSGRPPERAVPAS